MNRRNVLIGLGGVVAGGGALLGTGAFTTVEAERTVSVETAGDADAFLALSAARDDFDEENFVTEGDDGTIQINLDENSPGGGDGINRNARSRFENLVEVTNNGTQNVGTLELEIEVSETDDNDGHEDAFKIAVGDETLDPTSDDPVGILDAGENESPLEPGESATFGVEIDLLIEDGIDDIEEGAVFTLTITAEAEE